MEFQVQMQRHCCHVAIGIVCYVGGEWATLRQSRSRRHPSFFPLGCVCNGKKKGPTGLLSFSLSFIYCSILFPFVLVLLFSPRTSRREVAVRLDLILPFSKNNDFAEKIFATFIGLGLQVKQSVFREYSFTFVLEKIALCISSRFLSISVR